MKKSGILCLIMSLWFGILAAGDESGTGLLIPRIGGPVKIDGVLDEDAWKNATVLTPFLTLRRFPLEGVTARVYLMADRDSLYIGMDMNQEVGTDDARQTELKADALRHDDPVHRDDSVEIILGPGRNSGLLYQIAVNIKGVIFDRQVEPSPKISWTAGDIDIRHKVDGLKWTMEARIPFKMIGSDDGEGVLLNICRNWQGKGSTSLGGEEYFKRSAMRRLSIQKGKGIHLESFSGGDGEAAFSLKPVGSDAFRYSLKAIDSEGRILAENSGELPANRVSCLNLNGLQGQEATIQLDIRDAEKNQVLAYSLNMKEKNKVMLPPPMGKCELPGPRTLNMRFYPGFNRLGFDCGRGQKGDIAELILSARMGNDEKIQMKVKYEEKPFYGSLQLPEREGTWEFDLAGLDKNGRAVFEKRNVFSVERKIRDWENCRLGLSEKILPPFIPLKLQGDEISVLLRQYRSGALGLWSQVRTKGKDILAAPVSLTAEQNGKAMVWRNESRSIVEEKDSKIVITNRASAGELEAETICDYDYDGMMWVKLKLSSKKPISLDGLKLKISLKGDEATLMNCFADLIRRNKVGSIPSGEGEVWNSSGIPRRLIDGVPVVKHGFVPYLWLGGVSRGIVWFADNYRNYNLNDQEPMIRLFRNQDGVVVAEISLWNQPGELNGEKTLEFGMQTTPVKPIPEFGRKLTGITMKKIPNAVTMLFPVRTLGMDNDFDQQHRTPEGRRLFQAFAKQLRGESIDQKDFTELQEKWLERLAGLYRPHEKEIKRRYRNLAQYINYKKGQAKQEIDRSLHADLLMCYNDPRLMYMDTPEYKDYCAEWWSPQPVSYLRAARTYPVPSKINYILHHQKIRLEDGNDIVYYDDTFILPRANPEIDPVFDQDGAPAPDMGILAMRELIRRTALMMHEMGREPLIMIHHTDALTIPAFSFGNMGLTWEMRYIPVDTQERFPEDYILAESTGLQCGLVPFVLNGIIEWQGLSRAKDWLEFRKHKTKSLLATTLQYNIKSYRKTFMEEIAYWTRLAMFNYGVGEDDCRFIPFWENQELVKCSPRYKVAIHRRGNTALLIVSCFGGNGKTDIHLDKKTLGIPADAEFTDLVSGESGSGDVFQAKIPYHEYALIHVGPPGTAAGLLPEAGARVIGWPENQSPGTDTMMDINALVMNPEKWQRRSSYTKTPNEKAEIRQSKDKLIFEVDNRAGDKPAGMVWTLDFPVPLSIEPGNGIKVSYRAEKTAEGIRIFSFSGKLATGDKKVVSFNMKADALPAGGEQILLSRSIFDGFSEITRIFVRVQALPRHTGRIELTDIQVLK